MDIGLVAGVILCESTTFSSHPSNPSSGVKTYQATGPLLLRCHLLMRQQAVSYVDYLIKLSWPLNLSAQYPYSLDGAAIWVILVCSLFLISITYLLLKFSKDQLYMAMGWLWFIVTLLPVIGIFYNGIQIRADRYTYNSHIGLIMAVVWIAWDLAGRSKIAKIIFTVIAPVLVFMLLDLILKCDMIFNEISANWNRGKT
jgi:hypothetical protein